MSAPYFSATFRAAVIAHTRVCHSGHLITPRRPGPRRLSSVICSSLQATTRMSVRDTTPGFTAARLLTPYGNRVTRRRKPCRHGGPTWRGLLFWGLQGGPRGQPSRGGRSSPVVIFKLHLQTEGAQPSGESWPRGVVICIRAAW